MAHKILSVDDSRTIRMIVKKAFAPYDCELHEAENGVEGLDMAAKVQPDLIILDITMPVMTGVEMLAKLKEDDNLKNIPVIMLTAESGKDNVMQIVKMGVRDYIVKPFKGDQLIERATKILDLKQAAKAQVEAAGEGSTAKRYLKVAGGMPVLILPPKVSRNDAAQIDATLKEMLAKGSAPPRMICDLSNVTDFGITAIQLIVAVTIRCQRAKTALRFVGSKNQNEVLKGFQETSTIALDPSVEAAQAAF